ncbi:DUF2341 domain-containing protein, partial [Candidatus Omnitrophota bacterium]
MRSGISERKKFCGKVRIALLLGVAFVVGINLTILLGSLSSFEQDTSQTAVYQSALVWRSDELGDYVLPEMLPGRTYTLAQAIKSSGQIQSITASWQFVGEVKLELSADNGKNYTPAVYGLPLSQDLVVGDQLKWRLSLGEESQVSQLKISYTDSAGVQGTFGTPELSGFKFRRLISITNLNDQELFNYQLKIDVPAAGIEADFRDVRFACADGQTILPHYLEPNSTNTGVSASFWVKIPQLPQGSLPIYIYYGNPEARDLSNAEAVFDFFDGFDQDQLDQEKWQASTYLEGDYGLTDSLLKLDAAKIISRDFQLSEGIIELRAKARAAGGEIRTVIREEKQDQQRTQLAYSSNYSGAEHAVAVGNIVQKNSGQPIELGNFYDYRIIAQGVQLTFERYALSYQALGAEVKYEDKNGLLRGFIGLETAGAGNNDRVAEYDWIRVRKLAAIEPKVELQGQAEKVNLAEFLQSEISANGNLILSGQYTTATLPAGCQISAITPLISVVGAEEQAAGEKAVALEISADGGKNWRSDCKSGQTYQAPRDFSRGEELKLRAAQKGNTTQVPELEQIKLEYTVGPIVSSKHIRCLGASGRGGEYIQGDKVIIEWDNTLRGDNNPDILAVSCNI